MLPGPPRRRRARPVADAPIDVLLDQTEDLAKGWLLALLERSPLDDAPRILAADLPQEGPRVCAAVLRALARDADLRRLEPGEALAPLVTRTGELAGATSPEEKAQAVDALQAVIWSALRAELRDPDPDLVLELSARLADVSALVRTAVLAEKVPFVSPVQTDEPSGYRGGSDDPRPGAAGVYWEQSSAGGSGHAGRPGDPPLSVVPEVPAPEDQPRAHPERESALRGWVSPPPAAEDSQPLWVGALQDEIRRTGGAPLSLLLAELEDADRVLAVESESDSADIFSAFTQAVRRAVRRHDILVCETSTRAWVIARDTGRAGAQALGERISAAVREGQWRGAPLTVGIGQAVLGEDGRIPAELIEAAEEARFAASARGSV